VRRAALLCLLMLGACKADKQISGIGPWNVNRTHLRDATGRCTPDGDGMYCFGQKPTGIKGMIVDIDLYFAGHEPDAQLSEIQMKVGGCDEEQLFSWMRANFGKPTEDRGSLKMWQNSFLWAVGEMPLADDPGRCLVHMIPKRAQDRLDALWK
jgi:hypothetical protein